MKIKNLFCIAIIVGCLFGCKEKKETTTSEISDTISFQKVLDSIYTANKDAVGIMVHIESPSQEISWSGAVGFSDKDTQVPIEANQPAIIASNTKTYVAVAMLRLIEEGKLTLKTTIDGYISDKTDSLLLENAYATDAITVEHLLSHTSGVFDYAGTERYLELVKKDPNHQWTRDEQIELAMSMSKPLGIAGEVFAYSDTNYLLLTEIIETITKKPFYLAIRELIDYDALGLKSTWFVTQEAYPKATKPLVHQYVTSMGLNSYIIDQTFDSFGGGGLAATTKDLAVFSQSVFNNKVFNTAETLALIYTKATPKQPMQGDYYLGLSSIDINGTKGYGHGGFWGTAVNYFPDLDTSIAVFILDRDQRILRLHVNEALVDVLKK